LRPSPPKNTIFGEGKGTRGVNKKWVEPEVRDDVVKYLAEIRRMSHLGIGKLIGMLGIRRDKYYDWAKRYGMENNHNGKIPKKHWLTPEEREAIIDYAGTYIASH
jgi:putative transposase